MPLRLRLGLVFALATAVLVGAVGSGFVLQLQTSLNATLDSDLSSRASILLDEYDTGGTSALRLAQDEQPVQVLLPDGRVLASSSGLSEQPVLDSAQRLDVLARARAGTPPLTFTSGEQDDRIRFLALPTTAPGDALLIVGTDTDVSDAANDHVEKALIVLGLPAVLAAGLGAWWLAGAALRPVERMRRQTAEISDRDSGAKIAVPQTRDEIASLATTMNELLDRLHGALAHERGFVADAGHELRTPLATLRAELELAARPGRTEEDLREAVTSAGEETERLIRLAEDLLLLTRAQNERSFLRRTRLDLITVAAASARGAAALADRRDIDVVVDGPTTMPVRGDPDRLRQVIDNLLQNAVRQSPEHGVILLSVDRPRKTTIRLAVADDGPGFPPDFLPHAFERFRRADTARTRSEGGNGLGLAIVEAIVQAHGGRAWAINRPQGGALVQIELPALPPDPDTDGTGSHPNPGDAAGVARPSGPRQEVGPPGDVASSRAPAR